MAIELYPESVLAYGNRAAANLKVCDVLIWVYLWQII
jgi:hypothetical protein